MNLLLVVPPSENNKKINRMIDCGHEAKADYLWHPNDLIIISSLCAPEDIVVLADATAERLSIPQVLGNLARQNPDLVIMALSGVCWEHDHAFFLSIRELFPSKPVFVLGDIFLEDDYKELILKECAGIITNPYLLDLRLMAQSQSPVVPPPGTVTHVSDVPYPSKRPISGKTNTPRHELFLNKNYCFPLARRFKFATVTTMWGCPFSCSYCTVSRLQPFVRRTEDILDELEHLRTLGVEELFFADRTFGFPPENSRKLVEAMAQRFKFSWCCYFHPQLYDETLLEAMEAAGCHTLIVGIDSADLGSLKRFGRDVTREKLEGLLRKADSLGISVCADFIIGLPRENEQAVRNTLAYAMEQPLDFAAFNIAAPLPGSDIRRLARERNLLQFGKEGFDTYGRGGILGSAEISGERLKSLRRRATLSFYLRPSYIFRRLKRTASIEHFLVQFRQMLSLFSKNG
jgi:anaerobic magnesium-protoporphyrin IX monomethyl ester cyclase